MADSVIIVHGGAGLWSTDDLPEAKACIRNAVLVGYELLRSGKSAVDAVEAAVIVLEDHPMFNAGYGSYLTIDGKVEMDALIMDGRTQAVGAVAGADSVRHPISLARLVMEKTDHCLIIGPTLDRLAKEGGLERASQDDLISPRARKLLNRFLAKKAESARQDVESGARQDANSGACQDANSGARQDANSGARQDVESGARQDVESGVRQDVESGARQDANSGARQDVESGVRQELGVCQDTVGAVALDSQGNLAAATSTGGRNGSLSGRVGDSPLPGSGGWAENGVVAVSTTGKGEDILRDCLARRVAEGVDRGHSVQVSSEAAVARQSSRFHSRSGLISVGADGNVGVALTPGIKMVWASASSGRLKVGMETEPEMEEDL